MGILGGSSEFFGLDIGTTEVRVVQLRGQGPVKNLVAYGAAPLDPRAALSDAAVDQKSVASVIAQLVKSANISTKNVAVNLPSTRVFTAVIDMDRVTPEELSKAINYQADSLIPTPVDKSKIDYAMLGDSPKDTAKIEVLISSVTNDFIESRLDLLESIGLNVIAFEPDGMAITRAFIAPDTASPQLIVDMGYKSTDLVIVLNGSPRLIRSIPIGAETLVRAAMQNLNVDATQARQIVFKFGVSKDKMEGQVYRALGTSIETLNNEIEKSAKFFLARYSNVSIERIIVGGYAASLPELPLMIANRFNIQVEVGNAWRNVSFDQAKQNDLLTVSNHYSIAAGLAERKS